MTSLYTFRAPVPALVALLTFVALAPGGQAQPLNTSNPSSPVKLAFVHHSTGENWLGDDNGGLGIALRDANYFVSDTNYGWGPEDADAGGGTIGDHTDVGRFYSWFVGPNRVVLFKSCSPNSNLQGSLDDPVPAIASNPLRQQDSSSEHHTFANAKGIYQSLLTYFAKRQD